MAVLLPMFLSSSCTFMEQLRNPGYVPLIIFLNFFFSFRINWHVVCGLSCTHKIQVVNFFNLSGLVWE